jgi:Leucine-rich repeat (LRR) protein
VNKSIGDLKQLRYLDLGKNKIASLPYEIGNLRKLEFLQIWGNEVSQLPESMSDLTALKWLDMRAILLTDSEREEILLFLPETELLLSPGCNCGK